MTDIVRIKDKYYVRATSALADARVRILKYGSTIAVLNRFGDIEGAGFGQTGIFHQETRHVSKWTLQINGMPPLLLNSVIHDDNSFLSVDLTNPELSLKSGGSLLRETLHLFRAKFVLGDTCYEEVRVNNYGQEPVTITLALVFDADFADIFEIRGTKRQNRGARLADEVSADHVTLSYRGLDNIFRRTQLQFSPQPAGLTARQARFELNLPPKQETFLHFSASCEQQAASRSVAVTSPEDYSGAFARLRESTEGSRTQECRLSFLDSEYETWFRRSRNDLHLLTVGNAEGKYPYAGVPWFNTVFGRDGLITALETLWISPDIASSVLKFLAASQATSEDAERDAQPGKILHELRHGEMANTGEVPFGCYYGSVDATPLFVILAGAYRNRTGELELIRRLWPNIEAALSWIDQYGDSDGDGFVEYSRRSHTGLVQQGWKDSSDSVFHAGGRIADPPIALCEVQAYVYAAKRLAACMARELGKKQYADELDAAATQLLTQFEKQFWDEELGTYVLALDGEKKPCRVRASNAGQVLFCKIASPERAGRVRDLMMSNAMFSGWGIRTLAASEIRYNPMSYHNGSIWPHDNALIALGFSTYGFQEDAARLLSGIKEASYYFDLRRLPELFCGFHKRANSIGPTIYPVACSPQAWSAGSAFLLLRASLGMTVRADPCEVHFHNPHLPAGLGEIVLENLHAGDATADLAIHECKGSVKIETLRKEGSVEVLKHNS